jgi:hypothetical protein
MYIPIYNCKYMYNYTKYVMYFGKISKISTNYRITNGNLIRHLKYS